MKINNRMYDAIKTAALVATPLIAFLAALCSIWNVSHAEQITASLTALDTLLGALVLVLSREYNKEVPSEFDKEMDAMGAGEEEDYEDGEDDE